MPINNRFRRWQGAVSVLVVMLTLVMVNLSIIDKEHHLAEGKIVLLEMMPVDPRSIMQGDYMRIRFKLEAAIRARFNSQDFADGLAILRLDQRNVGYFEGIGELGFQVPEGKVGVRFRMRNGRVTFATSSFMFQEGMREHYEQAKFGVFKLNEQGEPLLTDLVIEPKVEPQP